MPNGIKLALNEMIDSLFGVKTSPRVNPLVDEVGVTATRILPIDPQRLSFVVFNLSANSIYIAPDNLVSTTRGIYLAPGGGSASLIWDIDFELCSWEWYAIASAANSDIFILANRSA